MRPVYSQGSGSQFVFDLKFIPKFLIFLTLIIISTSYRRHPLHKRLDGVTMKAIVWKQAHMTTISQLETSNHNRTIQITSTVDRSQTSH